MKLRILNANHVRQALPMSEAIDAMRVAFAAHARGQTQSPQRLVIATAAGSSLFMPAYLPESDALAQKIVSVFSGNPAHGLPAIHGLVIVLDPNTGQPQALLEGASLTAIRTGAASGLATDLLARPQAQVLALIGAGGQAYDQIRAVLAVREIVEVRIASKGGKRAERLAQRLREEGVNAQAVDVREAVQGADIITTVTDSRTPVFLDADVAPGAHINLVGAYTRDMQEAPASTIMRAKVYVDDVMAAAHEAGDLIKPVRAGLYSMNDLAGTLGQLILGEVPGRESEEEITVFKSVGLAVQDAAAAARALARAEQWSLGAEIEL
ncbi:MAG TPA: ornithine cyclodeaminase [Caldilineales bacterium]|nr:ornithine cyclodeaminase [Caldilineales bacterium]